MPTICVVLWRKCTSQHLLQFGSGHWEVLGSLNPSPTQKPLPLIRVVLKEIFQEFLKCAGQDPIPWASIYYNLFASLAETEDSLTFFILGKLPVESLTSNEHKNIASIFAQRGWSLWKYRGYLTCIFTSLVSAFRLQQNKKFSLSLSLCNEWCNVSSTPIVLVQHYTHRAHARSTIHKTCKCSLTSFPGNYNETKLTAGISNLLQGRK